jgi:hypothetical protein
LVPTTDSKNTLHSGIDWGIHITTCDGRTLFQVFQFGNLLEIPLENHNLLDLIITSLVTQQTELLQRCLWLDLVIHMIGGIIIIIQLCNCYDIIHKWINRLFSNNWYCSLYNTSWSSETWPLCNLVDGKIWSDD